MHFRQLSADYLSLDSLIDLIERRKSIRYALFVCLGLFIFVVLKQCLLNDPLKHFTQAQLEESALKKAVEWKQNEVRKLPMYRLSAQKMAVELENKKAILPKNNELPSLLEAITRLGKQLGLSLTRFEPEDEIDQGFYTKRAITMAVTGHYLSFAHFINQITHFKRLVTIDVLEITTPPNTDAERNQEGFLSMQVHAYIYRDKSRPQDEDYTKTRGQRAVKKANWMDHFQYTQTRQDVFINSMMTQETPRENLAWPVQRHKHRHYLERFPLDTLQWVGYLSKQEGQYSALIATYEGQISLAEQGEYIGQNQGKIIKITEQSLLIEEPTEEGKQPKQREIRLNLKPKA